MKERDYDRYRVLGSNAAVQERVPERKTDERQKDIERIQRNRRLRALDKEKYIRKSVLQIAALIFIMGSITITGNARLYSMQKDLSKLESQVKEVASNNEALSLQLLKVSSIENIKTYAENTLGMTNPDKSSTVHENLSVDYLQDGEKLQENKESIFSKIKDALF